MNTLLIVDDHEGFRSFVASMLDGDEFTVTGIAEDGETALEAVASLRPDLVLLDIQLPGLDGLGLTRLLKSNPATLEIPIVALSAHARPEDRQAALEAGCVDYISKPIDTRALPGQLAAVLRKFGRGC